MTNERINKVSESVVTAVLFLSCLIFFSVFYKYHLFFSEQLQIFLLTFEHFLTYLSKPAGISSYLGDFFTQFYYLRGGGAVVITITLFVLWLFNRLLLKKITGNNFAIMLPLLPVVFSWVGLCNLQFPLSDVISLIISAGITLLYISIPSGRIRFPVGLIMLPVLYFSAGAGLYIFAAIAVCHEIFHTDNPYRYLIASILAIIAFFIPPGLKNYYLLTTGQAYTYLSVMSHYQGFGQFLPMIFFIITILVTLLPLKRAGIDIHSSLSSLLLIFLISVFLVAGVFLNSDFRLEKILRLDYEASHNQWVKVYDLSNRNRMRNSISAYYTNMALSKLGLMPDKLMEYYQPAATGLFIPVNANENYMTITFSNEVYWQLGDVNASQHSALLGMIFSPNCQNVRLMKRLVEINIVNGEYAVAEKFISILEKTMFHRKWASDRRKFLFNENECLKSDWIMSKRDIIPSKDLLKKGNEFVKTLRFLIDSHPSNKMAVDYLLCYHLLIKDIPSFITDFRKYYSSGRNVLLPRVYQEGILISIASGKDNIEAYKKFRFSPEVIKSMTEYTGMYEENGGRGAPLQKKYGKTYWFYYHFAILTSENKDL